MNTALPSSPAPDAVLSELAALGMRVGRVVARVMEIEQASLEVVAGWLPAVGPAPASLAEAVGAGQSVDGVEAALATGVPRVEGLARAYDRVARSVRRTVALMRRMEAGWPRAGSADDRRAMVRRQVARGVAAVIERTCEGEAAERLFEELAERLDDGYVDDTMPVEAMVRLICRDLGLAAEALEPGVKRTTVLLRGAGQSPDTCRPTPAGNHNGFDTG